jgi:hypothetical protein
MPQSVHQRDYRVLRVPMLAGWLFADLFLVLFIVAFSSQPAVPSPTLTPGPTPTITSTPTPIRPHRPTPVGLKQIPANITVDVSPADVDNAATRAHAVAALMSGLRAQLAQKHLLGERSGFVLVFVTSVAGANDPINEAVNVAKRIIPILRTQDAATFRGTSGEGLWGGSGEDFHFQIFFFT